MLIPIIIACQRHIKSDLTEIITNNNGNDNTNDNNDVTGKDKEKAKDKDGEEEFSSKAQVMTLMTTDVDRVSEFGWHLFSLVDSPIEIIMGGYFLYTLLGISAFWGLAASLGACFYLFSLSSLYPEYLLIISRIFYNPVFVPISQWASKAGMYLSYRQKNSIQINVFPLILLNSP
jgi:hypothetical protein